MLTETKIFVVKGLIAIVALALGMLAVVGFEWLLRTRLGVDISPSIRNIVAAVFGLYLADKIVGKELANQFEIEKKKRNG